MQYLLKLRKWVKGSRLRPVAGAVSLVLSLCCGAVAVGCLLPLSYSAGKLAFYVVAERVHEAPAVPAPELNGRLVKLQGTGLSTECELTDAETGVTRRALVLRRAAGNRTQEGEERYGTAASTMQLGAYRLVNTPVSKIWPFHGPEPAGAVKVKSVPGGQHVMCLPSPSAETTWYVVARQQGDALHMEDPAAFFATADEWTACDRAFERGGAAGGSLWAGTLSLLGGVILCLWGTVACWRSAWSCLADVKEYSRIPAWLSALFCAPAFALLGGAGCLLHYVVARVTVYQYASQNTIITLALLGLAVLVVWYRLRRWFKFRMMF